MTRAVSPFGAGAALGADAAPRADTALRAVSALGSVVAMAAVAALASLAVGPPARALESTARSGPVELRVALEPDAPRIGDALVLTLEAIAEPGVELLMPEFGEALDRFRIVDFVPRERVGEDGRHHASQRYTLQAPRSGEHRIPSLLVEFVDRRPGQTPAPEDEDAYEILSEPIAFEVASVVPDAATAALHPPFGRLDPLGRGRNMLLGVLAAVLVLAAAAAPFAWRAYARLRARAAVRSAYDVARSELDRLARAPLPDAAAVGDFFVALSGIVRRYLEARFRLRSPELTTERFLDLVSGSPDLSDEHQALLRDFLRECDLVKFAHVIPGEEKIRQAVAAATRFLEETREPVATAAAAQQTTSNAEQAA